MPANPKATRGRRALAQYRHAGAERVASVCGAGRAQPQPALVFVSPFRVAAAFIGSWRDRAKFSVVSLQLRFGNLLIFRGFSRPQNEQEGTDQSALHLGEFGDGPFF